MKIDNINDFERLERPRVQEIPDFYGKKLLMELLLKNYLCLVMRVSIVIGMPSLFYDINDVDERRVNPIDNDIIPYDWDCKMVMIN